MNKLTLDLDGLTVDSFEIVECETERGTVEGFWAWSENSVCPTTDPDSRRQCPI